MPVITTDFDLTSIIFLFKERQNTNYDYFINLLLFDCYRIQIVVKFSNCFVLVKLCMLSLKVKCRVDKCIIICEIFELNLINPAMMLESKLTQSNVCLCNIQY